MRREGAELARRLANAEAACLRSGHALEAMANAVERAKALSPAISSTLDGVVTAARLEELTELVDNLNRHIASQPVIEQAKGILMARSHCTPDEAFDQLRRASMRSNVKVRDIARQVVEAAGRRRHSGTRALKRTVG